MARAGGRAVSKHFHNPIVPTPPRPMKIFILRDQNPGFRVRFTYSRAREERFSWTFRRLLRLNSEATSGISWFLSVADFISKSKGIELIEEINWILGRNWKLEGIFNGDVDFYSLNEFCFLLFRISRSDENLNIYFLILFHRGSSGFFSVKI